MNLLLYLNPLFPSNILVIYDWNKSTCISMNKQCIHIHLCKSKRFVFAHSKSILNGWVWWYLKATVDRKHTQTHHITLKYQQLHLYLNIYASSSILIADSTKKSCLSLPDTTLLNIQVYQTWKHVMKYTKQAIIRYKTIDRLYWIEIDLISYGFCTLQIHASDTWTKCKTDFHSIQREKTKKVMRKMRSHIQYT